MMSSTGSTGLGSTRALIGSNLLGYMGCSRLQQYAGGKGLFEIAPRDPKKGDPQMHLKNFLNIYRQ